MHKTVKHGEACPVEEYIDGECDIPVCTDFGSSDEWGKDFL